MKFKLCSTNEDLSIYDIPQMYDLEYHKYRWEEKVTIQSATIEIDTLEELVDLVNDLNAQSCQRIEERTGKKVGYGIDGIIVLPSPDGKTELEIYDGYRE